MPKLILNVSDGRMDRPAERLLIVRLPWPNTVVSGVRIGSETCSRLLDFIQPEQAAWQVRQIKAAGLQAWFAFPNISESQWPKAVSLLECCTQAGADGIVVNDFGMLDEARKAGQTVILGRLFDKRMRDARTGTAWEQERVLEEPGLFTLEWRRLCEREKVYAAEMECFGSLAGAPKSLRLWIHAPYILLSCGRLCEFGGIGAKQENRYRIGQCRRQCARVRSTASAGFLQGRIDHWQNGLYMMGKKAFLEEALSVNPELTVLYCENQAGIFKEDGNDSDYVTTE